MSTTTEDNTSESLELIAGLAELERRGFKSPLQLKPGEKLTLKLTATEWDALIVALEAFSELDDETLSAMGARDLTLEIMAFGAKRRMSNALESN